MDKLKLSQKNNIKNEIRISETLLKKNEDTIERLKKITENVDFNKKQIEKIREQQVLIENNIKELNNKYEIIISGGFDEEIKTQIRTDKERIKKEQNLLHEKKKEEKEIKKAKEKENLDIEYKSRKGSGLNEYQIKRETDKFFKDCSLLPDYMIENLKDMPCNKGYIWRGIWCFGSKKAESDIITMFEKCKGGLLKILEITNKYEYLYEKQGQGKKELIYKIERKKLL